MTIDPVNRAQILDDAYNLGKAEIIDQVVFLNISRYIKYEEDNLPFGVSLSGLTFIFDMVSIDASVSNSYKVKTKRKFELM